MQRFCLDSGTQTSVAAFSAYSPALSSGKPHLFWTTTDNSQIRQPSSPRAFSVLVAMIMISVLVCVTRTSTPEYPSSAISWVRNVHFSFEDAIFFKDKLSLLGNLHCHLGSHTLERKECCGFLTDPVIILEYPFWCLIPLIYLNNCFFFLWSLNWCI